MNKKKKREEKQKFSNTQICLVGIDLAALEKRNTGVCVIHIKNKNLITSNVDTLHTDKQILSLLKNLLIDKKKLIIAIDAPLSIPKGRSLGSFRSFSHLRNLKSSDMKLKTRKELHLRECDTELLRLGIKFFPITLGPMRKLTLRGIKLKKAIQNLCKNLNKKVEVIEVYPGGAQDVLHIKRKPTHELFRGLMKLMKGLRIKIKNMPKNKDELDAMTAAYVALCYLKNRYAALGNKKEGLIIMPRPQCSRHKL